MTRRQELAVHGGLALFVAALFFHVLLLGETWFLRDALSIHHVWRGHVLGELGAAWLPGWWDSVGLGTPVAGNPLFGALYPPSWPLALLPAGFAVDLLFVAHVWLAASGVARLSSRLGASPLGAFVGGASFAAGGWATSMVIMGIPLLTGAWTPHVVVAADDLARAGRGRDVVRRALLLAAVWALQLLAGDPAVAIATLPLVAIVVLVRAPRRAVGLARVAVAGVAALPLAALVLIPAVAYLADSERAGGLLASQASIWSMHPLRVVEWIWPRVLGDPTDLTLHLARLVADDGFHGKLEAAFTPALFVGAPVLVLAGLAATATRPLRWIAAAATLLFVLLALGGHTPFYALWRAVVLPERFVRYPERHLLPALVVWSALAGVGFSAALRDPRRAAGWMGTAAALLGALVGGAWLARGRLEAWLGDLRPEGGPPVIVDRALDLVLSSGATAVAFVALVAAALLLATRPRTARLAPGLAAALILGELWSVHAAAQPTIDRALVDSFPAWLAPLAADRRAGAPPPRAYRDAFLGHVALRLAPREVAVIAHESLSDHTLVGFGVGEVPGYHTTEPTRQARLWDAANRAPFERLLDLFDVRWAILADGDPRARGLVERAKAPTRYRLYENTSRRPRAFVAPRWSFVAGENAAIDALLAPGLDFHGVRLEGPADPAPPPAAAEQTLAPCDVATPRPERVTVRCAAPFAGWAVLLDAWSPGWSATVDGARAEVRRAEALARAVRVPAGEHVVEWRYEVPGLWRGVGIAGAAWLAWAMTLWLSGRRRGAA